MKTFFLKYQDGYHAAKGHKIVVPGFEYLSLYAYHTKAGSSNLWHVTEGWTGFDVTPYGKNFFTKKRLIEACSESFKVYEQKGNSFDLIIRMTLEQGHMAPMPINHV